MGCEAADIGHTIHPHPTLSESVGMAAEVYEGTITDLYLPEAQAGLTSTGAIVCAPKKAKPRRERRGFGKPAARTDEEVEAGLVED